MGAKFIPRKVKAEWGIGCNQRADGTLWVGKGYGRTVEEELGTDIAASAAVLLRRERASRAGRFWIDPNNRCVTIMIGEGDENEYRQVEY